MKYYTVKCNIESKDLNEEKYGVMMLYNDGGREYVLDVSERIEDVQILVDRMNNYNIEPCQVKEIIEDFKFNNK